MTVRVPLTTFVLTFLLGAATQCSAADKTALELLPASTAVYVEVPKPADVIGAIFDHPLATQLEDEEAYRQLLVSPEYGKFRLGLGFVELAIGMSWRKAIEGLSAGGIHFGVDARTNGAVALIQARDQATLERFRDLALKFARDEARKKGEPDPVKSAEYRGITAYRVDQARFATLGPWLVLTNKDELGKWIVDTWLDGNPENLGADAGFRAARASRRGEPAAWSFVRLAALRDAGVGKGLFAGRAENPVAELLLGGLLSTLQKTPHLTAQADLDRQGLRVRLAVPHDRSWVPASRAYFFGPDGRAEAPRLLRPTGTLFNLTAYRDFAGWWNSAPELFDENTNAQIAKSNSDLSTLFGGRDFGQDILSTVEPDWQLVVTRQKYAEGDTSPKLKLPAGALVFRLRDPEKNRRLWKVTFQSLIGFLNVVGGMESRPSFELDSSTLAGGQIVSAQYGPPGSDGRLTAGAIYYNFSPSMVTVGDRLILSTSRPLAEELAQLKPEAVEPAGDRRINAQVRLDGPSAREALIDNRGQLIAQNMLDKGHDREHAEREIDTLLVLTKVVRSLGFTLQQEAGELQLEFELAVRELKEPAKPATGANQP